MTKEWFRYSVCALAMTLMPTMVLAAKRIETVGGIEWEYVITNGKAQIGSGSYQDRAIPSTTTGAISIPKKLGGCLVASIGADAFFKCEWLTEVTIPEGVSSIADSAFYRCVALKKINVDSSNAYYKSENGLLLTKDGKVLVVGVNGDVVIPSGVTSIRECAFRGLRGLTSVAMASSITSIGRNAFDDCNVLKSVNIPRGVKCIDDFTFYNCYGLTSIMIPDGVEGIGEYAFSGCSKLTEVTIPSSVASIGGSAFGGCSGLIKIAFEGNEPQCNLYEFGAASSTCGVWVRRGTSGWGAVPGTWHGLPIDYIDNFHYADGGPYKEVVGGIEWTFMVKNGKAQVGTGLFEESAVDWMNTAGAINIPSVLGGCQVTDIEAWAFYHCDSITSVTIPSSVTSIGNSAFYYCRGLISVTIPSSVTSIWSDAFLGCSDLRSITIPSSVKNIGNSVFRGCSSLTAVTIPNGFTSISQNMFSGCSGLTRVTIPSSVTSIGHYAFYYCSNLTSLTIPEGVSIGEYALQGCSKLTELEIPTNARIGANAFSYCRGLESVKISHGVTGIASGAFNGCESLTSVMIPSSVTSIGWYAFNECTRLQFVYVDLGDADRVRGLYSWSGSVLFEEILKPTLEGDEGATVTGDAESGFVIKPSMGNAAVEVTIPKGVDVAKVMVEVSTSVQTVKSNGAKVKVVVGENDITEFLNVPAADGDGVIDLTKATVKEEIVKETMDVEKGAEIKLDAANPSLTTPNTRKGLFYQLREGATLDGMKDGDSTIGDGQPWSPEITVKGGNSAFYSIGVGKGD